MKRILVMALVLAGVAGAADYYPSMKVFKLGNIYDDGTGMIAAVEFYGRTMDAVVNGGTLTHTNGEYWFDSLKTIAKVNSWSVATYIYSNYHHLYVCGDTTASNAAGQVNCEWYRTALACDAVGGNRDSMFVTCGDDSTEQTLVASGSTCAGHATGTRVIDGSAADVKQQRFSQDSWWNEAGDWAYPAGRMNIMNYWDADVKVYRPKGLLDWVTNYQPLDSPVNGYYADNCGYIAGATGKDYWHLARGTYGGATGGAAWSTSTADLDWDQIASPYSTNAATVFGKFCEFMQACSETLLTADYHTIANWANYSAGYMDNLLIHGANAAMDVFFETRLGDVTTGYWSNLAGDLARMDTCRNHPAVRNYWEYRVLSGEADDTGNSWSAHTAFGSFLAIQDTASYFCYQGRYNNSGADGDTLYWTNFEIFRADLGTPEANSYTIVTTGTTNGGGAVHLLVREYTKGYAIYLPKELTGSDTTDYYTYDVGEPVYILGQDHVGHMDSTYSGGSVNIKYQHAVILQKTDVATDPIISRTPATFTFTATEGGSNPANQTLNISNSGVGTLDWALTDDADWLSLGTASGENTGSSTVIVDISGLSAGIYNATITITDPDADNTPQNVAVELVVSSPPVTINGKILRGKVYLKGKVKI